MNRDTRIWIAGQYGMVGSAIWNRLRVDGFTDLHFAPRLSYHSSEEPPRRFPDLTSRHETIEFMESWKPEVVVMAAGRVGGIVGNSTYPVEFLVENFRMACNVMEGAAKIRVKKLLYLGSSCIYPRHAPQPMQPRHLLTSPLEPTNEPYALAKIAGVRLCQYYRRQYGMNFIAAMPCNLYGPGDRYHVSDSHVIPSLIMKFHEATTKKRRSMTCLGDGSPEREFLYVEDLAKACVTLLEKYDGQEIVNIGSGKSVTIRHLAELVAATTGFKGRIKWNGRLNGMPKKLMDSSEIRNLGWQPTTRIEIGLQLAYQDYLGRHK